MVYNGIGYFLILHGLSKINDLLNFRRPIPIDPEENMIYFTGDTHGELSRFKTSAAKKLKKGDTLIICGDFGFIWNESKEELGNIKWLSKRKYQILFVEGAHENFELLEKFPKVDFCGGRARKISENIYQLIRGEIFEIEGKKIFAFGGGDDEELDVNDFRESPDFVRLPSEEECEHARENLEKTEKQVDYIVSYDTGFKMRGFLEMESNCFNNLHAFLNEVSIDCKFEKWFFGCFHMDRRVPPFYYAVYENIYDSETGKEL